MVDRKGKGNYTGHCALEGSDSARRGCCQVETEKTLLFTISPRRPRSGSPGAYVCLYCWPVVAFSGRIIPPLNNAHHSECFSWEVNDSLLRIMRASGSIMARNKGKMDIGHVHAPQRKLNISVITEALSCLRSSLTSVENESCLT